MNRIRVKKRAFSYFITTNLLQQRVSTYFRSNFERSIRYGISRFHIFMEALTLFLMNFLLFVLPLKIWLRNRCRNVYRVHFAIYSNKYYILLGFGKCLFLGLIINTVYKIIIYRQSHNSSFTTCQ